MSRLFCVFRVINNQISCAYYLACEWSIVCKTHNVVIASVQVVYKQICWRVKYLANRSVIVVGVTVRKGVDAIHIIQMKLWRRWLIWKTNENSPSPQIKITGFTAK